MSTRFVQSWLSGEPRAEALLGSGWRTREGRGAAVARAAGRGVDPSLMAALRDQHDALPASPARARNLDRLAAGAVCVVTGQQVGLFTGPLYSFYKALSAIEMARALEAETGRAVVPVFWLQAEDHDLAEIATARVPGDDGEPVVMGLDVPEQWRASVVGRALGDDVTAALRTLADALEGRPRAAEALLLLGRHYRPGRGVVDAFAGAFAEIFAEEGLIVLQPRVEAIARLAAPIHLRALRESDAIGALLDARAGALRRADLAVQIEPRADCALSFFHPEGPEGPRHRLRRAAGGWRAAGSPAERTQAELEHTLAQSPLSMSTSALLRPIVQDALLPTVAYVGGPGEVSYFAQLAPLYEHFGLAMPMIVHRGRALLIEAETQALLDTLGLSAADLSKPERAQLEQLQIPEVPELTPQHIREALEVPLIRGLDGIQAAFEALDPTMARTLRGARHKIQHQIDRLAHRTQVSRLIRAPERRRALALARGLLRPGGAPQERVYGLPWFIAGPGLDALKSSVRQAFSDPWSPELREVSL